MLTLSDFTYYTWIYVTKFFKKYVSSKENWMYEIKM